MNRRTSLFALSFMLGIVCLSPPAHAQCGGYGGCGWYPFFNNAYQNANWDPPPFYAIFPPVYYSYAVPRTYGYSPFAYPPGVMTPDVTVTGPLSIENPYVPKSSTVKPKGASDRVAVADPKPLVIDNPFVARESFSQQPLTAQMNR